MRFPRYLSIRTSSIELKQNLLPADIIPGTRRMWQPSTNIHNFTTDVTNPRDWWWVCLSSKHAENQFQRVEKLFDVLSNRISWPCEASIKLLLFVQRPICVYQISPARRPKAYDWVRSCVLDFFHSARAHPNRAFRDLKVKKQLMQHLV